MWSKIASFSCPPKPEPRTVENNEKKHSKRPALTRTRYKSKKKVDSAPTHSPTRSKYLSSLILVQTTSTIYCITYSIIYLSLSFIATSPLNPSFFYFHLPVFCSPLSLGTQVGSLSVSYGLDKQSKHIDCFSCLTSDWTSAAKERHRQWLTNKPNSVPHLPNFEFNCMEPHTLGIIWNPFLPGYS